jgi:glycolate oxidase iron-sulfur subunit
VALHLPCSQDAASAAALRQLLARVPGLQLCELPDRGCCGGAGLHALAEPQRAAALRAPVLQSLAESGASELLSANIGCRLHLGNGSPLPIRHPLEFLSEHLE